MRLKQIGSAGYKTRRYHERPNETSNTEVKETMKVAITAKRVVILMMTMALAVAMVACEAATPTPKPGEKGDTGDTGPPGPAGTSDNAEPMPVKDLPMLYIALGGSGMSPGKMAADITLGDHFKDAETPTLTYKVKSVVPKDVATVKIEGGKTKT